MCICSRRPLPHPVLALYVSADNTDLAKRNTVLTCLSVLFVLNLLLTDPSTWTTLCNGNLIISSITFFPCSTSPEGCSLALRTSWTWPVVSLRLKKANVGLACRRLISHPPRVVVLNRDEEFKAEI